ncbi:MAG TPA: AIR synthase related protein, partial [Acidimicrobiales bacterium]
SAVLRLAAPGLPPSERGLALTTDSNPAWCALDPRAGTVATVAEAALNLACSGATPKAVVNCLNFGNPEHPEVMWQLSEAIDGMAEACLALGLPVIGALGLIDHLAARPPGVTLVDGGVLVLLDASAARSDTGHRPPSLAGSRWAVELRHHRNGTLAPIDLAGHARLVEFVSGLVAEGVAGGDGLVQGIHDVSGGGLGVALAELAVRSGVGLQASGVGDHHELFTETPSRVIVCTTDSHRLLSRAADAGVGFRVLGAAGGDRIVIGDLVDVPVAEATDAWRTRLPDLLDDLAPVSN